MQIKTVTSRYLGAKCYIIVENGHAIVIDPCEAGELETALEGLVLDCVLLTHEHADHISGVNFLRERYGIPVACSEKCAKYIEDPRMNYSLYFESIKMLMGYLQTDNDCCMEPFTCRADITFSEDCESQWQGHTLLAKLTPGHAAGGVSYLFDGCVLFVGDNIFLEKETVTRFKGGSKWELEEITLPWMRTLNPKTQIYPGHFEPLLLHQWQGLERAQ